MAKKSRNNKRKGMADKKAAKVLEKESDIKTNPFEFKINRKKKNIIGNPTRKFEKGFPGQSRLKAIEKRKSTLLQDALKSKKTNKFIDKRIGEYDSAVSVEDKMLARYAAEQKRNGKAIGALKGDEELTHYGHTLASIEKFDVPVSDNDDEEEDKLNEEFVSKAHFGGLFVKRDPEESAKDRDAVIAEMILKSKERKENKQKEKEVIEVFTEKLDSLLKDLQPLLHSKKKKYEEEQEKSMSSYDILVRELKFESRAQASDPRKMAEEIARKEKIKNDKAEKELRERMQMPIERNKLTEHRSADDLDDGFVLSGDETNKKDEEKKGSDTQNDDEKDEENEEVEDADEEEITEAILGFIKCCLKENTALTKYFKKNNQLLLLSSVETNEVINDTPLSTDPLLLQKLEVLNHLVKRSPSIFADCIIDRLKDNRETFLKSYRKKSLNINVFCEIVLVFKLIQLLYSTSDFRHQVATTAMILMAEILIHLDTNRFSHVTTGLYICSLFFEYTQLSKRYMPECLVFISTVFDSLATKVVGTTTSVCKSQENELHVSVQNARHLIINNCVTLVTKLLKTYRLSFYDKVLDKVKLTVAILTNSDVKLPSDIQDNLTVLKSQLESKSDITLEKLVQDDSKRFSVKLLTPRLKKTTNKRVTKKQEKRKKHREMKSTQREIRKDNLFMADRQLREQSERDQIRKRKVKELYQSVAEESGYYKSMSKKKFKS